MCYKGETHARASVSMSGDRPARSRGRVAVAATLALLAAACGETADEQPAAANQAQAASVGADKDPVIAAALRDQIMVDPKLVQQANADTLRPPAQPESLGLPPENVADAAFKAEAGALKTAPAASDKCPQCAAARRALTLGALAASQGASANCVRNTAYSANWANRLPQSVPLYPDARVTEAAGADQQGCALRVVSFVSAAPPQRLLDWYHTRTSEAGYRNGHGMEGADHVLAGTRPAAAFMLHVRRRDGGGTSVDLMVDDAR
ncbi:hypothetical protein SPDO_08010 [Sphingomonas dokdonensis]|uniref:Uncharacterized protein n=2 Tax=Sphingomonas dokdonensis TaxID=344880 RepID=A0A245ZW27_9SPHN|nr:hypothetical protein SPDO_08010 [Sphingomonas dokdonensis]